jgi:hypothetical protein
MVSRCVPYPLVIEREIMALIVVQSAAFPPRDCVETFFSYGTTPFGKRTGHRNPSPSIDITMSALHDGNSRGSRGMKSFGPMLANEKTCPSTRSSTRTSAERPFCWIGCSMTSPKSKTLERAEKYAKLKKLTIHEKIGDGCDGFVMSTNSKTAVKEFNFKKLFDQDLEIYEYLRKRDIFEVNGFQIPRLVASDPGL